MKYTISTIKDIFEQIPEDKIDQFCRDLVSSHKHYHSIRKLYEPVAELLGEDPKSLDMQEPIIWSDDEKGEERFTLQSPDGEVATTIAFQTENNESKN